MKPQFDPSLYLVTDRPLCGARGLEAVVEAAVKGGVTMVQLREKDCTQEEFIQIARRVGNLTRPLGIPLIINDNVDVALAANAEGVHIGQSDMPYPEARQALGPDTLIGLSVENMDQVGEAEEWDVDYLGISPVFATPTKTDTAPPWGLESLPFLREVSRHVLIGIGGLNIDNAAEAVAAGLDGIAVVSAICAAPDPEAASRELRTAVGEGLK